jgi:hypothetical protein
VNKIVKKKEGMGSFAFQPNKKKTDWTKKNSLKTPSSLVSSALFLLNFYSLAFFAASTHSLPTKP